MNKTPKSLRLQIGIFGRTNVGKSSFLNFIAGQDVALTSPVAGTTTDVIEKSMELLPIGPVVFLDTGGIDDSTVLSEGRISKTKKAFTRADVAVLITEPEIWGPYEEQVLEEVRLRKVPAMIVVNKTDITVPSDAFREKIDSLKVPFMFCNSIQKESHDMVLQEFKKNLLRLMPEGVLSGPPLVADLITAGSLVIFVIPIDLQAPKGRLILPQVQSIREALDSDASVLLVKEREYAFMLKQLKIKPALVVCDSQVVLKMVADTPDDIPCTTFSILFSRLKGDLFEETLALQKIEELKDEDKILISEACTHHALEDDIGRVKIPRWLRQYTGLDLKIDIKTGRDYPINLKDYTLVIHCGACMLTRREKLFRIQTAKENGTCITNYGLCISFLQGVLSRVLSPFPDVLEAYENIRRKK